MIDLTKNPIKESKGHRYYHGIIPFEEIQVGQEWISSSGHRVIITKISEDKWVYYDQIGNPSAPPHDKHHFSFQCRYSLIAKNE